MASIRYWILPWAVSAALLAPIAGATSIPYEDLDPLGPLCTLSVAQAGATRILEWDPVEGAGYYRVGFRRCDGVIVGLAEVMTTSYVHVGWRPDECLDYVLVAYPMEGGQPLCYAIAEDFGDCPCR